MFAATKGSCVSSWEIASSGRLSTVMSVSERNITELDVLDTTMLANQRTLFSENRCERTGHCARRNLCPMFSLIAHDFQRVFLGDVSFIISPLPERR